MTDFFADIDPDAVGARSLWIRRAVLLALTAIPVLALLNVFGQRPAESSFVGPAATLRVSAPRTVRGGIFFQARIDVRAHRDLPHPRLVLERGWFEGLQVNSTEPQPMTEATRQGRVVLTYDKLEAGDLLRVWLQFEVNPTTVGRHPFDVELDDAERPVAHISRTLTLLP
ncbi:MAG TPA: hypothetical protein VGJ70_19920 [Solirubrobacteraceae bacterium]|jgi:hypothetical protein